MAAYPALRIWRTGPVRWRGRRSDSGRCSGLVHQPVRAVACLGAVAAFLPIFSSICIPLLECEPLVHNLSLAKHNLSLAKQNLSLAKHNLSLAKHNLSLECHNLSLAKHNLSLKCHNLSLHTPHTKFGVSQTTGALSACACSRCVRERGALHGRGRDCSLPACACSRCVGE
jgi:hypothetical protein